MCVCERERERELHQTNKMGKKARAFFLVDPHNLISMQQNVVNNRPKHKKTQSWTIQQKKQNMQTSRQTDRQVFRLSP